MLLEDLLSNSSSNNFWVATASLCVALVLPLLLELLGMVVSRRPSAASASSLVVSSSRDAAAVTTKPKETRGVTTTATTTTTPYLTRNTPESRRTWLPYVGQGITLLLHPPWDLLKTWNERHGGVIAFPLLGSTIFSLTDAAAVKAVLQSHTRHFKKDVENTMKPFLSILGTGIVTSEGAAWLRQRRKMSHPLRADVLEIIPRQTVAAVQRLMRQLDQAAAREQTVPLGSLLRHLTLQVISGSFLSLPPDDSDSTFAKYYLPIVDESNVRVWHSYRRYCFFLPSFWKYHWNVYQLNACVSKLIRDRWTLRRREEEQRQQQQTNNNNEKKPSSSRRREDILDKVLADYEKEFPNDPVLPEYAVRQFRDEMKTFMLAGHE